MSRKALALAGLLGLGACDQWHLSINRDGLVFVSVIDGTGQRDGYRVRTRQSHGTVQVVDLPASGVLRLSPVASGILELTLLPPAGCTVAGANPRVLTVGVDVTVRVSFDVRCGG
ncbi:MAG: hypothetical protein ACREMZ_12695 [Gemmatimonadales bacterium]